MSFSYHLTGDSISVSFPTATGRYSEVISNADSRYKVVVDLLKKLVGATDQLKKDLFEQIKGSIARQALKQGDRGVYLQGGKLYIDGVVLPSALEARVLQFERDNLPYEYLIKFFRKLQGNPSEHSKQMLYQFLEHNGHPITEDGNFIAYRSVTKDFKDHRTRTFDNSVGSVCQMPREKVNPDPNKTCESGLHVATREYAVGFSSGENIVEVEVDPADVVCVPNDYNGTKMRVCKFKVVGVSEKLLEEVLYKKEPQTTSDGWRCDECGSVVENGQTVCTSCNLIEWCSSCGEPVGDEAGDLCSDCESEAENENCPHTEAVTPQTQAQTLALTIPDRFKRKLEGGFVEEIEYRSGNVTLTLKKGRYRYYDVPVAALTQIYTLIENGTNVSQVFSEITTSIINGGYKYDKLN